jgi:pimeloyl-ACP methyl ester carboxylesterase
VPYVMSSGGVRIRFEIVGSGPPLVLHIGGFGSLEDWEDAGYVAALRDTYRLILLDPRGQGQSDAPHDPADYGPTERVQDVLTVLDTLRLQHAHFWGYSLGGGVGFALAATASDRLLSLIAGGADPYPGSDRRADEHPWIPLLQKGMTALVAACEAEDPAFFVSAGERARWLALDAKAMIAAMTAEPATAGVADRLPGLMTPTLIYCGTADNPEPSERAARSMPNASFAPLAGLDHAQAINRSDLILPDVRAFLDKLKNSSK